MMQLIDRSIGGAAMRGSGKTAAARSAPLDAGQGVARRAQLPSCALTR
jgi:hypothetical protein